MSMKIMRGLPGSGKTTKARQFKDAAICSTDDYWLRPDGTYDFNAKLLGKAHKWNQDRVEEYIKDGKDVVVDNTNTTFKEILPYLETAAKYDTPWTIVEPDTAWAFSLSHLVLYGKHDVPVDVLTKMMSRWEPHELILHQAQIEGFSHLYFELTPEVV